MLPYPHDDANASKDNHDVFIKASLLGGDAWSGNGCQVVSYLGLSFMHPCLPMFGMIQEMLNVSRKKQHIVGQR
jgi:hypothetical protein